MALFRDFAFSYFCLVILGLSTVTDEMQIENMICFEDPNSLVSFSFLRRTLKIDLITKCNNLDLLSFLDVHGNRQEINSTKNKFRKE